MNSFKAIDSYSLLPANRFALILLLAISIAAGLCVRTHASKGGIDSSEVARSQEGEKLVVTLLRKGAGGSVPASEPAPLKRVAFDLSQYFAASATDRQHAVVLEFKHTFLAGESARLKIENNSKKTIRAILFNMDATGKVSAIYPSQTIDGALSTSRLQPGEGAEINDFKVIDKAGEESFKLLIVNQGRLDLDEENSFGPDIGVSTRRSVSEPKGITGGQSNIGSIFTTSGKTGKSVEYYDLTLAVLRSRTERAVESEIAALNNRGLAYYKTSNYEKAIKDYRDALQMLEGAGLEKNAHLGYRASILSNLGQVYSSLGNFDLGDKNYQEALSIKREIQDREGIVIVLNNIGTVHSARRDYRSAERYFLDSLKFLSSLPATLKRRLKNVEATAYGNLAQIYLALNKADEASRYARQSILLSQETRNRLSEGLAHNNLGSIYLHLKEYRQAIAEYQWAVKLFRQEGNRMGEAIVYSNLMFAFEGYQKPLMAIAYGKWSVDLLQQIRSESGGLEKDLQRSFITSRGDTYRELADLLISRGRIPEAERVLEMLKEEELLQYALRDRAVASELSKRPDLSDEERRAIEAYAKVADEITALSRELEELDAERKADAPFTKQARYDEVKSKIDAAFQMFEVFERQLSKEFGEDSSRVQQLKSGLQARLKGWDSPDTVIISTIVGAERTHIIVTTTRVQEPHTVSLSKEELNRLIADFRTAIKDPCACIDPRPAGKKLYDLLIKPIEGALDGAKAKTLLWSLDGSLRYIPIAALWDGKQYMVERYQNVIITLAKTDDLDDKRKPVGELRALGAGVSKERGAEFPALKAVQDELKNVVRKESAQNKEEEWGVIPGERLLDEEFKRKTFQDAIVKYSVIHIASHFDFKPGNERSSVLLLGDGELLSLKDVSSDPLMFSGVELLTLSACNTATGGNGTEVEGFGGLAQMRGAKSVLASLWAVADRSTGVLMKQFYTNLRDNQEMTKSEALRQAQLDLLMGRVVVPSAIDELRDKNNGKTDEAKTGTAFVPDPKRPRSHPYYWAPFILIGNWK